MILLRQGRVVDPESGLDKTADVLIVDDKIAEIAENIDLRQYIKNELSADDSEIEKIVSEAEVYDCSGCIIGPGLVDIHVHFRDPGFTYKEDILSGAKSAAAGGVTSVILMANTKPAVDNVETLKYVLDKGKETDIHVYTCANVTEGLKGELVTDFANLKSKGAIGFTDDGIPMLDESKVREAMQKAKENDAVLSFHEENPAFITNNGINRGKASEHFGIGGSDRQAEIDMVSRDVRLAMEIGAKINIQHISSKETLEIIREAKAATKGKQLIFAEATPHHIALTEEAAIKYGTMAKMNPPLRTEDDRKAIIEAIKDDTIDFIATDHAPHALEEKSKAITDAPSGILGLETALPIAHEILVKDNDIPWTKVFEKMSTNPARLYKLNAGNLNIGAVADIVVFDENTSKVYERSLSKSQNSPFLGHEFPGKVAYTICAGKVIYKD